MSKSKEKNTRQRPNVAYLRKAQGDLTDQEFAYELKINVRTLKKMLSGSRGTRMTTYRQVAKQLRCKVEQLFIVGDVAEQVKQHYKHTPLALLRVHPEFSYDPFDDPNAQLRSRLTAEFMMLTERGIKEYGGEFFWNRVGSEFGGVFRSGSRMERALAAQNAAFSINRLCKTSPILAPPTGWLLAPRSGIHIDDSSRASELRIDTIAAHVAHRLQDAADPYGILISHTTFRTLRDVTDKLIIPVAKSIPLRYPNAKDKGQPHYIQPYLMKDQPAGRADFGLMLHQEPLRELCEAVKTSCSGVHFVQLIAPEGYGKTKILEELEQISTGHDCQVAMVECQASATPLQTATRLILQVLQLSDFSTEDDLEHKLKTYNRASYRESFEVLGPLLFEGRIEPRRNNEKIFTVLANILRQVRMARRLILIVDDAQRCDGMSLEFFEMLAQETDLSQISVVFSGSEIEGRLATLEPSQKIILTELDELQARQFATRLVNARPDCGVAVEEVVKRGKGVPSHLLLAFNELLLGISDQPDRNQFPDTHTPQFPVSILAAVTGSNDDSLSVLAIASILGERFDDKLLRLVWRELGHDEEDLDRALALLTKSQLLEMRKLPQSKEYRLSVRWMASQARDAHGQVDQQASEAIHIACAKILAAVRPGTHPAYLAKLYEDGGDRFAAVRCWHRAGEFCLGTDAQACHRAALEYFLHARDLLDMESDLSVRHERLKLQVLIGIVQSLMRESYASEEIEQALREARLLYHKVADPILSYKVVRAMWAKSHNMGDFSQALECIEELTRIVQDTDLLKISPYGAAALIEVHHAAAVTHFAMGSLHTALEHQIKAINLMVGESAELHRCCLEYSDHDPVACCLIIGAICHLLLGKSRRAGSWLKRAVRQLGDGHNVGTRMVVECFAALYHIIKADIISSQRHRQALLDDAFKHALVAEKLASENQVPHWHGMATIMKSICQARSAASADQLRLAIDDISSGIELWSQRGQTTLVPLWQSYLASAWMDLADRYRDLKEELARQEALHHAEQALQLAQKLIFKQDIAQYFVESATSRLARQRKDAKGSAKWRRKVTKTIRDQGLRAFPRNQRVRA